MHSLRLASVILSITLANSFTPCTRARPPSSCYTSSSAKRTRIRKGGCGPLNYEYDDDRQYSDTPFYPQSLPYMPLAEEEEEIYDPLRGLSLEEQVQYFKKKRAAEMQVKQSDEPMFNPDLEEDEEPPEYSPTYCQSSSPQTLHSLLHQRTLQCFLNHLTNCRDPHTARWLEEFADTPNIRSYHGLGGVTGTELEFYDRLCKEPRTYVTVEVPKRTVGHSPYNPYIKRETKQFQVTIDPPSLASRMLSVRRQVREEMQHDLKVIASVDVVSSYESCVKSRGSVETDVVRIDANLLKYDEIEVKGNSLLRASTFDLLCNLVTQEALVRVLRVSEKGSSGWHFLKAFYQDRLDLFNGPQSYYSAHKFVLDLLQAPPCVSQAAGGKVSLLDPRMIADKVLEVRKEVCEGWTPGEECWGKVLERQVGGEVDKVDELEE
mmetsp:Transcript_12208/g.24220  ORF Transcript_12208/g.24220 Transcript_12208/m.24220 type:complete len:434 (+) Transcript_12208:80-1381(+)